MRRRTPQHLLMHPYNRKQCQKQCHLPQKSTAGESYDDEDFYDDDFNGDGSGSAEENIEDSQDA